MDREHYEGKGVRVCTLKAWDRIDNLRDMENAPDDFSSLYATESRELHLVLAKTIGTRLAQRLAAAIDGLVPRTPSHK